MQRAAVDLLKELAREETACEAAGELGAIEPLMALLTASTARNDMGLQVTTKRSSQSPVPPCSNGCRPSQRATTKCLELLQRAAPNRERLARVRVTTLVTKLAEDEAAQDPTAIVDHAKSIAQLCRDDHSNVARFGEMGALPRLVGLLGRRGPTVDRAISAALRELGWDEENRSEIAELKVQPLVETLLDLV